MKWLFKESPVFFVTAATHRRRRLLAQERVQQAFLAFSEEAARRGVFVGRYVLMPDHVHFFVAIASEGPGLAKWMQILKITLAKSLRENGHVGPFWQKGFFDHVLRSAESYGQKWDYVQQNPVRTGLVEVAQDWPYQGEVFRLGYDL
ncbi:MAG: REP-associated tyrosine transposase [Terriglobia bacterium]